MCNRYEHFIKVQEEYLFCVVDEPKNPIGVIIMCHGLTGERTGPQQLLSLISGDLARQNFITIRFDFRGSGDSSDVFYNTSFSSMLADVEEIYLWGTKRYPDLPIVMLGISIGGIISTLAAIRLDCKCNIIISNDLAENIEFKSKKSIRSGQFYLNEKFWEERKKIYPRKMLKESRIPTKLYYGSLDEKVKSAARELSLFLELKEYNGVDHLFEDYFVRKQLSLDISSYLKIQLE